MQWEAVYTARDGGGGCNAGTVGTAPAKFMRNDKLCEGDDGKGAVGNSEYELDVNVGRKYTKST